MIRRFALLLGVGAACLPLANCATIHYDAATVDQMVAMNRIAPAGSFEQVGTVEIDKRAVFVVASLITVIDAEVEDIVQRELARTGADAVINLRIHEEYDIVDVLVSILAGGLVDTRSYTLRGDLVRLSTAARDADAFDHLAQSCHSVAVEADSEASRTGYLCLPPGMQLVGGEETARIQKTTDEPTS